MCKGFTKTAIKKNFLMDSIDITKTMMEEELIVKKLSENPEAIKLLRQLLDKTGTKEETKVE